MASSFRRAAAAVVALLSFVGTGNVLVLRHLTEPPQRMTVPVLLDAEPTLARALPSVLATPAPRTATVVPRADPRAARTRQVSQPPKVTPPLPAGRPSFTHATAQQRGAQALASLRRPLAPGWTAEFEVYNGSFVGFANATDKVVTLWVRPTDSPQSLRITLAHELGHVLDYTQLTKAGRADYLELRGVARHPGPWYPCNGCEDYDSPAGDFAEVYAYWLAGAGDFRSRVAPAPDSAQLQRLGAFFTQLERANQR